MLNLKPIGSWCSCKIAVAPPQALHYLHGFDVALWYWTRYLIYGELNTLIAGQVVKSVLVHQHGHPLKWEDDILAVCKVVSFMAILHWIARNTPQTNTKKSEHHRNWNHSRTPPLSNTQQAQSPSWSCGVGTITASTAPAPRGAHFSDIVAAASFLSCVQMKEKLCQMKEFFCHHRILHDFALEFCTL